MIARLLISTSLEKRVEEALKILLQSNLEKKHVDCLYFASDSKLGIEQARIIKEHFSLKPYSAKGRAVVLENASNLTIEAQNALLKILEELPKEAIFILGASSDAYFLPTIISRCQIVRVQGTGDSLPATLSLARRAGLQKDDYTKDIEKLIQSSIGERFEYIEKLKDKKDFLDSLIHYFHLKLPKYSNFTKELLQAEEWANQNVNIRAILEYLMLVMPRKNSD